VVAGWPSGLNAAKGPPQDNWGFRLDFPRRTRRGYLISRGWFRAYGESFRCDRLQSVIVVLLSCTITVRAHTSQMMAVTYARYSSELQRDSSIEDQQALCRTFAARSGYTITTEYADRAQSGASALGRDGLLSLMADAKIGAFKTVIVEALDRLSRDQEDLAAIYKRLTYAGVQILAVHDGKADPVQIGIRGLVGSLYLTDLANKTRRGLHGRVEAGKSAGGKAYGYRTIKGETGELEIVDDEAEIVRRIFRDYASGFSARDIAANLNRDGVPPPRGAHWMANTICGNAARKIGILHCELYRGKRVWNKQRYVKNPDTGKRVSRMNPEGEWVIADAPALRIVSDDEWNRAAARIQGTGRRSKGRPIGSGKKPRFLSGLIRCGVCGSSMIIGGRDKRGDRVVCSRFLGGRACIHRRQYSVDKVEKFITDLMVERVREKDNFAAYLDGYIEARRQEGVEAGKRRRAAETALTRAKQSLNRVLDQYETGVIDKKAMIERGTKWKAEVAAATATLAETPAAPGADYHPAAVMAYRRVLDDLAGYLNSGKMDRARGELRKLIDCVEILPTEPYQPYEIRVAGPIVAKRMVAGARNRLCSSPEIAEIDYSLYGGGWHVSPQFNQCELKTAA
jgi:site-specific DNA recombinase